MSRRAFGGARPAGRSDEEEPGERCPNCRRTRYLDPDMVLLVNPKCYHPICNNCVRTHYANGQRQCPREGCAKTLRRQDYRVAYFTDLTVEREVDQRKRVAEVFNQTADDFQTLVDYNDYLDKVETLVFDLLSDKAEARDAAEAILKRHEAEHKAQIERSRRRGAAAEENARLLLARERQAAEARRRQAKEQDLEEQRLKVMAKEEDLDSLARAPEGTAARLIIRKRDQHRLEALAASEARDLRTDKAGDGSGAGLGLGLGGGLSIRGLKEKKRATVDGPYDSFGGLDLGPSRYQLQDEYPNEWLDRAGRQTDHVTGGYSLHEYCSRALFEAFAGMAVFVGDEKETGLGGGASAAAVATLGASLAARRGSLDRMEVDAI